jgi:hypothetical protein
MGLRSMWVQQERPELRPGQEPEALRREPQQGPQQELRKNPQALVLRP